ncbi:unnamed protein product [Macrosiphum euphorbiae]|uniref:Uncharacterized protein n=1 Tax=Macrosiphum euphorbiae TaxID=13131 RepID=A0AAV0WPY2_9HEMI|nr:unnamed protein product [Macrosiphum euphorbiae]
MKKKRMISLESMMHTSFVNYHNAKLFYYSLKYKIITRIRLSFTLEPLPYQYHQQPYMEQLHVNVASPSPSSSSISNYTSTPLANEEYDMLSQAIINSFSDNDQ